MSKSRWVRFTVLALKFCLSFFWMTVVISMIWDHSTAGVYDHVDDYDDPWPGVGGLFDPGAWVDDTVVTVPQVVHGRYWTHLGIRYPDEIKQGWSVAGLWHLWYCLIALDLASSAILAGISWRKQLDGLFDWAHAPLGLRQVLTQILYFLLVGSILIPSVTITLFAWVALSLR
jgi:hypothetical protein